MLESDLVELLWHSQRGPQSAQYRILTPSIPRVEGSWQALLPEATLVGAIAVRAHIAVPFGEICRSVRFDGFQTLCCRTGWWLTIRAYGREFWTGQRERAFVGGERSGELVDVRTKAS